MMDLGTHEVLVSLAQSRATRAASKLIAAHAEQEAADTALSAAVAARDHWIANAPTDQPLML